MKLNPAFCTILCVATIGALFVLPSTDAHAGAPSFDCDQASAADEVAICSSNELSELDTLMNSGVQFLRGQLGKKQANQVARPLLGLRQACGGETDCIQQRQVDAIKAYQALGAPIRLPDWASDSSQSAVSSAGEMPGKIGQCSESKIEEIGGRLEGDASFETGTSVGYTNGGYQVSYDKEWSVVRSKIGDPVRICLMSLPKDCPAGDDRGKVYKTTNLRTGESWELADSQHMCGGA